MPTLRTACSALLVAVATTGCLSYAPAQVSAMSSLEICDLQLNQSPNMTDETQRLLRSELERRKETCAQHRAAIQARRDEELYDLTYGNQSP